MRRARRRFIDDAGAKRRPVLAVLARRVMSPLGHAISGLMRRSNLSFDHLVGESEQRTLHCKVARLSANSNLVGCMTGSSAGLSPLRILPQSRGVDRLGRLGQQT